MNDKEVFIKTIDINYENIDTISSKNIVAFKFAHYGAMGDRGTIHILINKDALKFYRLDYVNSDEDLCNRIMKEHLHFFAKYIQQTGLFLTDNFDGWKQYCMGMGNYMFVKNEYVSKFEDVANAYDNGLISDYISIVNVDTFLIETFKN